MLPVIEGSETASLLKLTGLTMLWSIPRSENLGKLSSAFESINGRFLIFKVSNKGSYGPSNGGLLATVNKEFVFERRDYNYILACF
jgi:hypothetical protein